MEEGTGKATSQRKEPTPWQAGGRVAPKGQSDSPEAAGHRKRVRGPVPASLKTAVTYGGDLSREVMGWTGQAGESPPPSPPPPRRSLHPPSPGPHLVRGDHRGRGDAVQGLQALEESV